MKMLKLRPLFPPTANTLDVPAVETVSLHDRFKSVWEAHNFDPVLDELESTCRTAINGGLYDAHICAVKQQARSSKVSECLMFHQLRWGRGNVACAPTVETLLTYRWEVSKYSDPAVRQRAWARKRVPSAATTSTSVRRPFRNLAMALGFSARPPTSSIDMAVGAPSWRCV